MHVIIQCCALFIWLHTLNSVNGAELTCYTGDGGNYRGTVSRTSSGKTCQRWPAQTPHSHSRTPENYPCKDLDNNYCRNPDGEKKPWCYTTDSEKRWEYCQIPTCDGVPEPASEPTIVPERTCFSCEGKNYRGTFARTISGKTCQRWSDQTPHRHGITPENLPHKGLDSNYCRNPNNEMKPWCYTTDSQTRWEYCGVSRCVAPDPQPVIARTETIVPEMTRKQTVVPEMTRKQTVVPEMSCYSGNGRNYRGTVSRTSSGKTCQRWPTQTPHSHSRTPENYPCKDLDNNYCRNPDNEMKPWCYTTDSEKRWEYCEIPTCNGVPEPEPTIVPERTCFTCEGKNYRGTRSRTITGKTCQRWSDQTPHSHGRRPENHPLDGLDSNYCRNPNNEMKPWCYTTDSRTRWEYCDVARCEGVPKPGVPQPAHPPVQFSGCGKPRLHYITPKPKQLTVQVARGTLASRGDYPWQASVQRRLRGSRRPFVHDCGGVLIASCWVLTAAHCIDSSMEMQVVLGTVNTRLNDENVQTIRVERNISHEDYTQIGGIAHNDIALLQLRVTDSSFCAKETRHVKTACLPTKLFPIGTKCVVSGWGGTEDDARPSQLSFAGTSLMNKQQCLANFAGYGVEANQLDNRVLCTEGLACQGDSGGPLMCKEGEVHYITGVVSWGQATCGGDQSVPGVYANVHTYVDWIKQKWLS